MRDWRYEKAFRSVPLTHNGTTTERLPADGMVSDLLLYIYAQNDNNMQNVPSQRLSTHVTNVTVIGDDDDIIVDASADQLRALYWDGNLQCPLEHNHCYGAKGQWTLVPIRFGRYERDEEYGLNLGAWTEVEVKVTNDFAATHFQAATGSMSARLLWHKTDELTPANFMSAVEIDSHRCTRANEYYTKKIAKLFPIRRIQVQDTVDVDSTTGEPKATRNSNIENIKLTTKTRENVIWDDKISELGYYNTKEYGADMETFFKPGNGTMMYPDVCLLDSRFITELQLGDAGVAAVAGALVADDQERYPLVRAWGAGDFASWHVIGSLPYGCGHFRFYSMKPYEREFDTPAQWLDVREHADVELEYLLGDTDGTVHTLTEASKPHPT